MWIVFHSKEKLYQFHYRVWSVGGYSSSSEVHRLSSRRDKSLWFGHYSSGGRGERKWYEKYYGKKHPEIKVIHQARSSKVILRLCWQQGENGMCVPWWSPSSSYCHLGKFAPTIFLCHGSLLQNHFFLVHLWWIGPWTTVSTAAQSSYRLLVGLYSSGILVA